MFSFVAIHDQNDKLIIFLSFTECSQNYVLLNGVCVASCPDRFFAETTTSGQVCMPCHYTCKKCRRGDDYECSLCYDDAKLYTPSDFESYCYPKSMFRQIDSSNWYYYTFVVLFLSITSSGIIFAIYGTYSCLVKKQEYQSVHLETVKNIRQIEDEIKTSIYSDSE